MFCEYNWRNFAYTKFDFFLLFLEKDIQYIKENLPKIENEFFNAFFFNFNNNSFFL